MTVELLTGTTNVKQNTEFQLSPNAVYLSTKNVKHCHGKWYYEATHYSGHNFNCIGFYMNEERIFLYPNNSTTAYFQDRKSVV